MLSNMICKLNKVEIDETRIIGVGSKPLIIFYHTKNGEEDYFYINTIPEEEYRITKYA